MHTQLVIKSIQKYSGMSFFRKDNFYNTCKYKLELNTEKEGCMSYTAPEDAQRPRAVYDTHSDFRGI